MNKKSSKNVLSSEFWGTSFGFWLTFAVFFLAVGVSFYFSYDSFSTISDPSVEKYVSPLADSFSVVLGLPIAFAGSVVAIILAQKSLSISRRQEQYENINFINGYVDDVYTRYVAASDALREYLSDVSDYSIYYFERSEELEDDLAGSEEQQQLKASLLESRRAFKKAVSFLGHNRLCSQLWERKAEDNSSLVAELDAHLSSHSDPDINSHWFNILDLDKGIQNYLYILDSAKITSSFVDLLRYYYEVEVDGEPSCEDGDTLLQPWDLFLVAGMILCHKESKVFTEDPEGHPEETPLVEEKLDDLNYGAAFICDFVSWYPSSTQIKDNIKLNLAEIINVDDHVAAYIDKIIENKHFDNMCPKTWNIAADYIADNSELLYSSKHEYFTAKSRFGEWYLEKVLGC